MKRLSLSLACWLGAARPSAYQKGKRDKHAMPPRAEQRTKKGKRKEQR
jgi:hypothetical protein